MKEITSLKKVKNDIKFEALVKFMGATTLSGGGTGRGFRPPPATEKDTLIPL